MRGSQENPFETYHSQEEDENVDVLFVDRTKSFMNEVADEVEHLDARK